MEILDDTGTEVPLGKNDNMEIKVPYETHNGLIRPVVLQRLAEGSTAWALYLKQCDALGQPVGTIVLHTPTKTEAERLARAVVAAMNANYATEETCDD